MKHGLLVTFEGIDGCGKTTQLNLLARHLRHTGRNVVETVEPGGTAAGRAIRAILLDPQHDSLSPSAELLLYFASRAQNVAEVIRPALERGAIVLSDRFTDSTRVYQGAGRGVAPQIIDELHQIACGTLQPDITLLLDIDLETSLARARSRNQTSGSSETRMDDQDAAFFKRVREGYAELAREQPRRVIVVDARDAIASVAARVWKAIEPHV